MTPEKHHAEALRWLAIAEAAYPQIEARGSFPVRVATGLAQVHATLATYRPPVTTDDEDRQAHVQNLLDDSARAFADADTSSERVEVLRDLLAGWYAAWPDTAVTDPNEGIAWQLASMISAAEARASGLPGWVLKLVAGLDRYELEHPELFRFTGDGYTRWGCPAPLLNLVPAEVRRQAEQTGKPAEPNPLRDRAAGPILDRAMGITPPHPPAEMVWLGDLSGFWVEPDGHGVIVRHRCGWTANVGIGYLANIIEDLVSAHRDAGCNPHEG